jgi:hypothetical protein
MQAKLERQEAEEREIKAILGGHVPEPCIGIWGVIRHPELSSSNLRVTW